jgi:uncharacterized protein YjdB
LPVGESETLFASVSPGNAANKTVTWTSNNSWVATVDASTGRVTALAVGTADITARSQDGGYTASCAVTVMAAQVVSVNFDDPGSAAFNQETFTVIKGGTPASQGITLTGDWTSGEWRVDGKVRGTGTSGFTVSAADYTVGGHALEVVVYQGSTPWSKTLRFTVTQAVTGISLNRAALTLPLGESETLFASVSPGNAANKTVMWMSNNSWVATVDASTGRVTAAGIGTANITARSQDGEYTASCTVTVMAAQAVSVRFSDPGSGAFDQETFTVIKGGSPDRQTITLTGAGNGG